MMPPLHCTNAQMQPNPKSGTDSIIQGCTDDNHTTESIGCWLKPWLAKPSWKPLVCAVILPVLSKYYTLDAVLPVAIISLPTSDCTCSRCIDKDVNKKQQQHPLSHLAAVSNLLPKWMSSLWLLSSSLNASAQFCNNVIWVFRLLSCLQQLLLRLLLVCMLYAALAWICLSLLLVLLL